MHKKSLPEKNCILFVDDEPNILQALQRMLRNKRHEWDMTFADSAAAALKILEDSRHDIIVSDLRMPNINGVQLLKTVQQRYPNMIRFILSGHGDTDLIIQSIGVAHQFMSKPCDADHLIEAIARATHLLDIFESDALREAIQNGTSSIPTLPELYQQLTQALQSPGSSAEKVSAIISRNIAISAKVLQLANSAFFGLSRRVDSISQAVTLLGAETINSMALTNQIFNQFDEQTVLEFHIREIYAHSVYVGALGHADSR